MLRGARVVARSYAAAGAVAAPWRRLRARPRAAVPRALPAVGVARAVASCRVRHRGVRPGGSAWMCHCALHPPWAPAGRGRARHSWRRAPFPRHLRALRARARRRHLRPHHGAHATPPLRRRRGCPLARASRELSLRAAQVVAACFVFTLVRAAPPALPVLAGFLPRKRIFTNSLELYSAAGVRIPCPRINRCGYIATGRRQCAGPHSSLQ